jgi:RNA polymerase sigma-70 factor (ECF subfamily)
MVTEDTGRELAEACRGGSREAFRALFEAYRDKVYAVALRYSGNRSTAMDITQDVFLKLFSRIGDYRGDASFEAWLYRIVANCCLDERRKARRLAPLIEDAVARLLPQRETLTEGLARRQTSRAVQAAVARLAPELRIAIVLRYTRGMSYDEIAETLGWPMGTVASRLARAHKELARRLPEKGNSHV